MRAQLAPLAIFAAAGYSLCAATGPAWMLARSEHFELYSQLDTYRSGQLLNWFEQARLAFLNQAIVPRAAIPPVRAFAFASAKEYEPYRIRAFSDGSYAESGDRRYITMLAGFDDRRVAAHELAHALLAADGAGTPLWLSEGLAEFFSTLRVGGSDVEIGGDLVARRQLLSRQSWIPLDELMSVTSEKSLGGGRERGEMFYAESWLLADMLVLSPHYGTRFNSMWDVLRSRRSAEEAFRLVYGESVERVERDLRAWMLRRDGAKTIRVARGAPSPRLVEVTELAENVVQPLLADMLAAAGEYDRAGILLEGLARSKSRNAEILAALGSIALRRGDAATAREDWKQAIARGLMDADIAYRYALLADAAALSTDEIRSALQRAIALRPDFDEARYKLALLEKNAGHFEAAVRELRAMRTIAPARAYAYWSAMADACNELGRRSEAMEAAHKAAQHALTPSERARAENLAYVAETDFAVQSARGVDGRVEMITTRVPHQSAADWNPFVEAGDDVRVVKGILREIECAEGVTRLHLDASGGLLTLAIEDPSRIRMRNAPDELTCGPQQDVIVDVQYAASKSASGDGLIRGIDFHPSPALEK
jgi:tetratricopeptide (TPR) repeat protein